MKPIGWKNWTRGNQLRKTRASGKQNRESVLTARKRKCFKKREWSTLLTSADKLSMMRVGNARWILQDEAQGSRNPAEVSWEENMKWESGGSDNKQLFQVASLWRRAEKWCSSCVEIWGQGRVFFSFLFFNMGGTRSHSGIESKWMMVKRRNNQRNKVPETGRKRWELEGN